MIENGPAMNGWAIFFLQTFGFGSSIQALYRRHGNQFWRGQNAFRVLSKKPQAGWDRHGGHAN
jgi:hypothetical protein